MGQFVLVKGFKYKVWSNKYMQKTLFQPVKYLVVTALCGKVHKCRFLKKLFRVVFLLVSFFGIVSFDFVPVNLDKLCQFECQVFLSKVIF